MDLTYIKLHCGFVYLVALIDIISRRIMGWNLSPFLETQACLEAFYMALKSGEIPVIINSDQGCQFTSAEWSQAMTISGVQISMDGKGCYLDNITIERFWRTIKYEEVYLKSYDSIDEARQEIGKYIMWYNEKRPHQSLEYKTPNEVFYEQVQRKPVDSFDKSSTYPTCPQGLQQQELIEVNFKSRLSSEIAA